MDKEGSPVGLVYARPRDTNATTAVHCAPVLEAAESCEVKPGAAPAAACVLTIYSMWRRVGADWEVRTRSVEQVGSQACVRPISNELFEVRDATRTAPRVIQVAPKQSSTSRRLFAEESKVEELAAESGSMQASPSIAPSVPPPTPSPTACNQTMWSPSPRAKLLLSYGSAAKACHSHGLQLCDASELCPARPGALSPAQFLGKIPPLWVPDRNAAHQWMFLGEPQGYSVHSGMRPMMQDAQMEVAGCRVSRNAKECATAAAREVNLTAALTCNDSGVL